jgi:hypothetical protein
MRYLNQLRICRRRWSLGQYPRKESSLWVTVKKPKDIAYRYAKLIKEICPSLQYIRIQDWSWEFVPRRKFKPSSIGPKLRELEFDELLAIEILSFDIFPPQAGLPGPEQPREPMTKEQEMRAERISMEVDAAIRAGVYGDLLRTSR